MSLYVKNGHIDDKAFDADVAMIKTLVSVLRRLGVSYEFRSGWWEYNTGDVEFHSKDLLGVMITELSKWYANVDNIGRTLEEVHRTREKVREALGTMDLKPDQLERFDEELRNRWPVVERI